MRRFVKFGDTRFFGLFAIALFLSVLFVSSVVKLFEKKREFGLQTGALEEKVAKLRHENKEMEEILNQAATPSFIEKEARRKLNMKKPGERMVIIVPSKTDEIKDVRLKIEEETNDKGFWWQKIKRFLFP